MALLLGRMTRYLCATDGLGLRTTCIYCTVTISLSDVLELETLIFFIRDDHVVFEVCDKIFPFRPLSLRHWCEFMNQTPYDLFKECKTVTWIFRSDGCTECFVHEHDERFYVTEMVLR